MSEKYTIDNVKNDIQNLQSQNLFDFQEIKRLERELKKVNDELHLHLRIYKNKLLSDNKEFTEIKEDYNNLFNIIDTTIIDIGMLQTDINTIKGNNNIYQTDIATLRTNVNQLQNNLTNINSLIANLQSVDTNINSRLNQVINTAIPIINGNINNLEQIVNANSQDIVDLNNRVTNLENNQDNTVATNLLTTVGNIRDRLNIAENDITNNKNKITGILTDINSIQNELNSFDTRLITVEDIVLGNLMTRLHVYEVNLQRFDVELDQAQLDIELLYHLIEQGGVGGGTGTGTGVTPELLQRLDNIEQSIIDTNIRIDNLQLTNIEQEVQLIRNTVTALQEQTDNLADDVMELADKVLNMDLSIMEDRITANENNITDLNTRVFNLESDNTQNKQDIVDINDRLDNLYIPPEIDLTDIENRVTNNETNITDLQEQIDNLDIPEDVDLTDIENRITTNEADITGLQEQIDNLDIPEDVDLTGIENRLTQLETKANLIPVAADNTTEYNLNNYKENGNYSIGTASSYANTPEISAGLLTVMRANTYRLQLYTVINNNNVYFRKSSNWAVSWSPWVLLNESTGSTEINTKLVQLETQVNELFQSVSNGKTLVANAITGKGITTSSSATFATMAQNIRNISTGENPYTMAYATTTCKTNSSTELTFNFSKAILSLKSITPPNSSASVRLTDYKTLGVSQYTVKLNVMNGSGEWKVGCVVYK